MINYVNNSFDKVLKPCDAQKFMELTQSEQTEKLILGHRAGEKNSKAKLPALTYMGVLDEEKYNCHLTQCEEQGTRPLGSRRADFMRPTGLLMLDFDHVGDARALFDGICKGASERGFDLGQCLALAHVTPSGDGLRLVVTRQMGLSIVGSQYRWTHDILPWLGVEPKCDDVCKDISRLSFAPIQSEVLYFNPSLLFAPLPDVCDYPNDDLFGQMLAVASPEVTAPTPQSEAREEYDTEYNGVPYSEIIERLEEQLGGRPERGARNAFIFTMACNLRYICNDDAQWVASVLPTYGEEPQKHRMTIQSAINRPMSREMPETLKRALGVARMCSDAEKSEIRNQKSEMAPAMPSALPEPIDLLTSRVPERTKSAVAMAVFPALGAYVKGLHLVYADGRPYEPTFMNILVAEQSAGKSAVNTPIDYILADIKDKDTAVLARERQWKEECSRIASTQEKPKRPDNLVVQILPSDMTNASFVQRLDDAKGHFLYTRMDEVELLNALRTNGTSNMVSAVLRLAFDCGEYGQVRVASNAINAMVNVRWNWNASSTVQRVRKYFAKNVADGTLSRLSFATIPEDEDDWGEEMPVYEEYGEHFARDLKIFTDRLATATGSVRCPEAVAWAMALNRELVGFARDADDRGYARMSRRGILMGFFRAMLLYVMNGMQWSREIEGFATWSVRYDLWCKMRFFRDMLRNDIEGERTAIQRGPVGLLSMLPNEFTREDVKALRIAQGMKPDPRSVLGQWVTRGAIVKDESRGVYVKTLTVDS